MPNKVAPTKSVKKAPKKIVPDKVSPILAAMEETSKKRKADSK